MLCGFKLLNDKKPQSNIVETANNKHYHPLLHCEQQQIQSGDRQQISITPTVNTHSMYLRIPQIIMKMLKNCNRLQTTATTTTQNVCTK